VSTYLKTEKKIYIYIYIIFLFYLKKIAIFSCSNKNYVTHKHT